ncbi:ThiJ/PfpI [Pholiota molesta]|nr:ThiJ/PfpI [Pholiota molesta]
MDNIKDNSPKPTSYYLRSSKTNACCSFVLTSADKTLTGHQTGWYLPEAAHPYYVLSPHASIDFAAPNGPNPPVDQGSVQQFKDEGSVKFLNDETVKAKLAHAKKLSEVDVKAYDAIFYVGGHGPVLDLAQDPTNAQLVSKFWDAGKIVSASAMGPRNALVGGVDASGKSIFAGRKATGFTNAEEIAVGKVQDIPFLLEDRISELGATFEKADNWAPHVVVDGRLITGQNPASAEPIGQLFSKLSLEATRQTIICRT